MLLAETSDLQNVKSGPAIDLTSILNGSFVYLLLQNNEVVYVGQTNSVGSRVSSHSRDKEFDRVSAIPVSKEQRLALESALIRILKPKYNKTIREKPTPEDFTLVESFDLVFDGVTLSPAIDVEVGDYGMVMVRRSPVWDDQEFSGKIGYYDDDEWVHLCADDIAKIGLSEVDLDDDITEKICEACGCHQVAIVYLESWADGWNEFQHEELVKVKITNEKTRRRFLNRMFPSAEGLVQEAVAQQMRLYDLEPEPTPEVTEMASKLASKVRGLNERISSEQQGFKRENGTPLVD
jgi:hypothetical protein